jgi:DNA-binding CsgD family transcriptional regulator
MADLKQQALIGMRLRFSNRSTRTFSALEGDILRLMMDGMPSREIAVELGLAETAVRDQVRSMLRKVRARSRFARDDT